MPIEQWLIPNPMATELPPLPDSHPHALSNITPETSKAASEISKSAGAWVAAASSGLLTPNEIRKEFGLQPIPEYHPHATTSAPLSFAHSVMPFVPASDSEHQDSQFSSDDPFASEYLNHLNPSCVTFTPLTPAQRSWLDRQLQAKAKAKEDENVVRPHFALETKRKIRLED
jgi:hypothetical protein